MKTSVVSLGLIITIAMLAAVPAAARVTVPASVKAAMQGVASASSIEVLLSFEDDLDLSALKVQSLRHKMTRVERYREVMTRLEQNRADLEKAITPRLEEMMQAGLVESFTFFTVSKTVLVKTLAGNVDALLTFPGVRLININEPVSLIAPVDETAVDYASKISTANAALQAINVPALWARGLTGAGTVVCSFDTGVEREHPALAGKWRGDNGVSASESWFAPRADTLPDDKLGHGTHTMGVMVGSTGSDTIGVAPGAQWISAAVIDQGTVFSTTIADILSAFDWALNPDGDLTTTDDLPDVINNSWGVPKGIYADCDNTFWSAIDNVEAAGIVTIFAAGNEGPEPSTLRNPADRASSPLNSLAVGAVDHQTMIVADFSSRGPAACNGSIKPEVVAPGVGIYSSYKDGTYKMMSGTSMAAPFVSGLVALMRQYNPDATVEEIKGALIAATTDLGPVGEDNAYGNGFIDASRVLDYLPEPTVPHLTVESHRVFAGGDLFADPGETAEFTLTISEPTGLLDAVDVWVRSLSDVLDYDTATIRFTFSAGTTYSVGPEPFVARVAADATSGENVQILVYFRVPGSIAIDSTYYSVLIGHAVPGDVFASTGGDIQLTASEFGQFGFGPGSIYPAGGNGFRFRDGDNLLFEGGLIVGRNSQMVSDAVRNDGGSFKDSEFLPAGDNSIQAAGGADAAVHVSYSDGGALLPIPLQISQTVWGSDDNFIVLEFTVTNPTAERLDNLSVGMFCDFDIDRYGDRIGYDSMAGIIYQYNAAEDTYVGMVGLSANEFATYAALNGAAKSGFTKSQKFDMINTTGLHIASAEAGDWYFSLSMSGAQVDAFDDRTLSVAVLAGTSLAELRYAATMALSAYGAYLDVEETIAALPDELELSQNYPNPFNPQTTIDFAMRSAQYVSLVVYNVTGQRVTTLFDGMAAAGRTSVVWDGHDDSGDQVASGIYFYRLVAEGGQVATKKMVMVK